MRVVEVLSGATGQTKVHTGPEYRTLLGRALVGLKRASKPLPFTELDAKRLPLTDLVRMDNEWSAQNNAGTYASVVER